MIAYSFYEGDNRVMRYAETLAARGDQVDVISVGKYGQPHAVILNEVQVYRIRTRRKNEQHQLTHLLRILMFLIRASIVVAWKHAGHRYDVIHVHSVPDFLVFAASIPMLTGASVILDIHDLMPELYASKFGVNAASPIFKALQIVERMSAACATHVIAPNHLWRKKLVQRSVSQSKCSVFMNYPDPALFSRRGRTRDESKLVLLYPGTLNWHQGLDVAIRAFAKNAALFPCSEFHIYGEGPEKYNLIQLASQIGVGHRVLFHLPCPLREIAVISENADLGIIPKRNDGFGDEAFSTKSLEFMMLGVPIIISKTTVDQYYFNPDVVTFVDSVSVNDLADAMRRLMESKSARRAQAERASRFVEEYAWSAHRDDYLNLVDQLVQRDPPAPRAPVGEAEASKVS